MSERGEQRALADYLDLLGVLWCHPANEGQQRLVRIGVKAGVPDVLIWAEPPNEPYLHGVAIELKEYGGKVSDEQVWWLEQLGKRGWAARVCYGADEAIDYLRGLGFVKLGQGRFA